MRVLFLDIDGVVTCTRTRRRHSRLAGIDPRLAEIVRGIAAAVPDLRVVLSSTWREEDGSKALAAKHVLPFFDSTPIFEGADDFRGHEIQAWLEIHPDVLRYAIIDDGDGMLPQQLPHFFRTDSRVGITQDIADRVVLHLLV